MPTSTRCSTAIALADAVAAALVEVSGAEARFRPASPREAPVGGMLAAMPGFLPGLGALGAKLVSVFPQNFDRPTHQAVMVCSIPRPARLSPSSTAR